MALTGAGTTARQAAACRGGTEVRIGSADGTSATAIDGAKDEEDAVEPLRSDAAQQRSASD